MSGAKDGGPAFPLVEPNAPCAVTPGMTLRDWFAGQALAGFCADPNIKSAADLPDAAYELADAMLVAREVQP